MLLALLIVPFLLSNGCVSADETDWWDEHRPAVRQALDGCIAEGENIEADTQQKTCNARCDFWETCANQKCEEFFRGGCMAEECEGLTGSECEQKCEGYTADHMDSECKCPWWWNEHGGDTGWIGGGECVNIGI